jgi:SulP family sulfate permease
MREFGHLLRNWRSAAILLATFGLTLLEDLTYGIIAGCGLALVFAAVDWLRGKPGKASP